VGSGRSGSSPRLAQLPPVEEEQRCPDEQEHDLVERSRDRQQADRREPAERARDLAVPKDEPDGAGELAEEGSGMRE